MKTILLDLKTSSKTLLVFALFFIVSIAQGATRYSVASGNWNSTSTWSATSGGAAGASVPVAGDVVFIEKGFNVTVTANAACTSITFTNNTATSLTINSGITLTVSGAITIPRVSSGSASNLIAVGAGSLNVASIAFTSGGSQVRHQMTISTGTVVVSGSITTDNTGAGATITFTGAGLLRVGGQLMSSGTVGGTLTTVAGSTVEYTGGAQTAKVATYNNLILSGSGVKTFTTSPTVNGVLSMEGTATVNVTTGAVIYGASATLQYNTATNRTASSEEWITSFAGTGGVIIKNTGTITLNTNKTFTNSPLTVKDGATLALSTFSLSTPSTLTLENGTTGSAITGTGLFTLGGDVTVNHAGSGSNAATISCPVALGATRSFTVANDGTSADDLTISGIISTANGLTKLGTGTMTLSGVNTYSGATTVTTGTLNVTGSLSSSSSVTVDSGDNLTGSGTIQGTVALTGNIAPGATTNSTGTLTTGVLNFNGGSSYTFDISNVSGTAGTEWDYLSASSEIHVFSTSASPTTIYLVGNPTGFSNCNSYTWQIANGTVVESFLSTDFVVNTNSFIPSFSGNFSVTKTGTGLNLEYTATSTAGAASSSPTLCINTALTAITHTTTGATGIGTATGLPTGVTVAWASNTITISGTPSASGTFNYSIPLSGGCGTVSATGTITVTAAKTATLTSAAGTNNQSACRNLAITNITYATTGATGKGTSSGLPSGVTATWASNVLTISGTPTASGTFNYSIPLTGGCGSLSVTGTITVKSIGTITLSSAAGTNAQTKCINTAITAITYTTTGATGATFTGLPTGVTGSWASNVVTISGTPTVSSELPYSYAVSLTNVCGSASGTIQVNSTLNAGSITTTGQTICNGSVPTTIGSTTNASGGNSVITYKWQANGVDISNSNTSTYTPAALSTTTTFTRFAKDGMCNTTFVQSSGSYVVTVMANPTAGSISGTQNLCSDATPATITSSTAGTASGTLSYRWEANTNIASPSWSTIVGATGDEYTPSVLASTTQFRRITISTTNGVTCESSPTSAIQVTVNAAVAVELDYVNDIAIGATSFTIPFVSTTGSPNQYSVTAVPNLMEDFTNVVNQSMGSSPLSVNIPTTTSAGVFNFQIVVRNSSTGCQSIPYDFDIMVTGIQHGTIGSNQTICYGTTPNTIQSTKFASTSSGTISYAWEQSTTSEVTGFTTIPGATASTYSPGPLTQTTYFKRVASNGLGDSADTDPITITVRDQFTAGSISATGESVCYNGNPSIINSITPASGGGQNITYKWEANGVLISQSNSATYNPPSGLTSTTTYVRFAKENSCNNSYVQSEGSWVVTVNPVSIGGTIDGPSNVCSGSAVGKVLTLTGHTGSVVRWESSVSPFTTWQSINVTTSTITTEPLTEKIKFRAIVKSGACSQTISSVLTINLNTESTSWVSGAWTNEAPDGDELVTISSSLVTNGTSISACALVVNNNATVVVSSGDTLTLTEGLTVASGSLVTLNNNAKLIQSGSTNLNSGAIVVKRTSSALRRQDYTLWSSPVAGQKLLPFSPNTLTNRFYTYNPNTNLYDVVASPSTTNFDTAKGYLIRVPNNHPTSPTTWTGTFTGVPNSGNYSMPIVYGGGNLRFNLVGNPYPSPINAVSFVNNATNYNSISGTIYFWRKTNNAAKPSYCTWTQGGFVHNGEAQVYDPNDVIQTGQGFFVEATGQGSTVEFDNSMRQEDHNNQFFRSINIIEKNRIWLNLTNTAGLFSQAMVGYITRATPGLDPLIDGKYINDGEIALTSLIQGTPYAIQGRGLPFRSTDVVPLNLKVTNAGSYTIAIDRVDGLFSNSEEIYLKDNLTGVVHNLRTSAYDFTSDAGNFDTRFEIVYQMPTMTTGKPEFNANQVVLYKDLNNSLIVNTGSEKMKTVKVFDIQGRLLLEQNNIDAAQTALNINGSTEVILVQITTENGAVVTKKYIMQRMTSKDEKLSMQKVQLAEDE